MYRRDYTDIACGAVLLLTGIFMVTYALGDMRLGTLSQMGPGYFPVIIGLALGGFGISIMMPGFFRAGTVEAVEWRSLIAVLAGVASFALLVRPFGLVPAIVSQLIVSSAAETVFRPFSLVVMALSMPFVGYLVFDLALGLNLVMIRRPF